MRRGLTGLLVTAALLLGGCASTPYRLHEGLETDFTLRLLEDEPQIERGRPNAWVDGFGHYFFSLPTKLILLNWRVNNHRISQEVEDALQIYLWANGLCNTKVRINQYAPGDEYRRLFANGEMPVGWRYTLGLLSVTFYAIFPGRLFAGFPIIGGGDSYNPYTNSLHIYSDLRSVALHEGGHAKDLAMTEGRQLKGLYAGARAVPLVGIPVALYQEAVASNDALSWELATGNARDSRSAYRTLYPAYGTYVGGAASTGAAYFLDRLWLLYAIQFGVVAAGHIGGQTRALFVRDRDEGLEPELLEIEPLPPAKNGETRDGQYELRPNPCQPDPVEPQLPEGHDRGRSERQIIRGRLLEVERLREQDLITEEEYEQIRQRILDDL